MGRFRGVRVGLLFVGCLTPIGCGGPATPTTPVPSLKGTHIVAAAVGDRSVLSNLASQLGEWQASREATCEVLKTPVDPAATAGSHVLIFRGDRLGDLVDAGALAILPEAVVRPPLRPASEEGGETEAAPKSDDDATATDPLQFTDVIPVFREQVSKSGTDRVALPYGGSALVLVYNRKALEHGPDSTPVPPKTWAEFDALVKRLHGTDWNGDGKPDTGVALAFGPDSDGVGDSTYLSRVASLGQHRDHYSLLFDSDTMDPRLTTPPFVKALEDHVALKAYGPKGVEAFDAEAARKAFREGNVAFLIDRAERAGGWGSDSAKSIGVAQLPGSERVYEPSRKVWEDVPKLNRPSYLPFGGGWLVAVSASAKGREREAAIDFVKYLINPETSNRVRADRDFPVLPVRSSQINQGIPDPRSAPGVEPKTWTDAVNKTLVALRVIPGLRIPHADDYLADLSKGRVSAVNGKPAADALKEVAEAWSARSKALGVERQLWHYRRSLNSLVTATQPPPKR